MKKFDQFLTESQSLHKLAMKKIAKNASYYRRVFEKEQEKQTKTIEKLEKKQDYIEKSNNKKEINDYILDAKKVINNSRALLGFVEKNKDILDNSIYAFLHDVASKVDLFKQETDGTRLISKNILLAKQIIDHPFVKSRLDIAEFISKLILVSDSGFNPKFGEFKYKLINNEIFKILKDLIIYIIKKEMLLQKGIF